MTVTSAPSPTIRERVGDVQIAARGQILVGAGDGEHIRARRGGDGVEPEGAFVSWTAARGVHFAARAAEPVAGHVVASVGGRIDCKHYAELSWHAEVQPSRSATFQVVALLGRIHDAVAAQTLHRTDVALRTDRPREPALIVGDASDSGVDGRSCRRGAGASE